MDWADFWPELVQPLLCPYSDGLGIYRRLQSISERVQVIGNSALSSSAEKKIRESASQNYPSNCFQSKSLGQVCGTSDFIVMLPFSCYIFHYSMSTSSLKSTTKNKLPNNLFSFPFSSIFKHPTLQKHMYSVFLNFRCKWSVLVLLQN